MKKTFTLTALLAVACGAMAQTGGGVAEAESFVAGGIRYSVTSAADRTVEVAKSEGDPYAGDIVVPQTVAHGVPAAGGLRCRPCAGAAVLRCRRQVAGLQAVVPACVSGFSRCPFFAWQGGRRLAGACRPSLPPGNFNEWYARLANFVYG